MGTPIDIDGDGDATNDDVTDTSDAGTDATDTTITDITDPDTTETDNPLDENPNDMTDPTDDPTTLIITPTPMLSLEKSITMVNDLDGNGIDQGRYSRLQF